MKHPCGIIVLHTTPFGEKGVVLHTLSSLWGRRSFLVRSAASCAAYFQPLSILDAVVTENPKSQLWTAGDFSLRRPLGGIRGSMGKSAISMFMAEVLYRGTREGAMEAELWSWLEKEIMLLDSLEEDFSNFHVLFLLEFCRALGFAAGYNDLLPFLEETALDASALLSCPDLSAALLLPLSGARRTALCRSILKYLEFHMETPLHIRSLDVLSELF